MDRENPASALTGFYLVALVATFMAMLVIIIINLSTPFEFSRDRISELMDSGWIMGMGLRLGRLVLATILSSLPLIAVMRRVLRPVRRYLAGPNPALRENAGRCLINLPFIMVPVNLGLWILVPATLFTLMFEFNLMDNTTAVTFTVRSFMVGLMSSAILFFSLEAYARKTLIPVIFPHGRLTDLDRTRRSSISRRIRAFYRLSSLIPLAHIVLTLFVLYLQVDDNPMSTREFAGSALIFSLVIFCIFFIGSGILTRLVGHSISTPVNEMVQTVKSIEKGDYTARVQVVSNDEIGILGDAFNHAVQGLADRQRIREAFGRYVDPRVRDEILSGRIPLDGEYKEVTVLFADLRNFTPLTASRDPKETVAVLNRYFKTMAGAIEANKGLILQFLGDEIYAVFGAPATDPDHPRHAVAAAVDMEKRLGALNLEFNAQGLPVLSHGIGIHTGRVLAANIGSPERLSYLLVGDTVNIASRLQAMTRELGARLILSRETVRHLPDLPEGLARHPEPVRAKGIDRPLEIYLG
ncbi:MAG: HAMP domain-containing protein [Desulfobacter sp.]|nr:MAG: HAMP domain-containing protein [Desulfobacter sp.]